MLGRLCDVLLQQTVESVPAGTETPHEALGKLLTFHLASKSALQRISVALVLYSWAKLNQVSLCAFSF